MEFGHVFEALMLICFGFSWPLNVIKAYKARTTKGTSLAFIFLIITGYIAGITAKFINHQFNYVLAVYFINLGIVMMNVFVYIRNKNIDKKNNLLKLKSTETIDTKVLSKVGNTNYSYSLDELIYPEKANTKEEKNAVILLGNGQDKMIPVQSLGREFKFNFKSFNKSSTSSVTTFFFNSCKQGDFF